LPRTVERPSSWLSRGGSTPSSTQPTGRWSMLTPWGAGRRKRNTGQMLFPIKFRGLNKEWEGGPARPPRFSPPLFDPSLPLRLPVAVEHRPREGHAGVAEHQEGVRRDPPGAAEARRAGPVSLRLLLRFDRRDAWMHGCMCAYMHVHSIRQRQHARTCW